MKKLFLLSTIFFTLVLGFSFSAVLATDNMTNTLKNVGNATKETTANASNAINRSATTTKNAMQNTVNSAKVTTQNGYDATRTATETQVRYAGMTATGWTWFIVAIVGILIVALVWYYARQQSSSTKKDHEE